MLFSCDVNRSVSGNLICFFMIYIKNTFKLFHSPTSFIHNTKRKACKIYKNLIKRNMNRHLILPTNLKINNYALYNQMMTLKLSSTEKTLFPT